MNLRKEIRQAYDTVHAPEETVEKLKQDLYLKDFHDFTESEAEPFLDAPKQTGIRRYAGFIAAAAVLGLVTGISMQSMLSRRSEEVFQPAATVPIEVTIPETTEPTSETAPDAIFD